MAAPVDLEEQKKTILPFMQRAQEIQAADPKVAYYCRLYAVEQAMKLTHRAKEVNALLVATLNQLEKDKAKLELDPAADRIHCLGFALRIFDNADRVDRAGKATERTSKAFYAASVFIEILNQFEGEGGVDSELFEKQRYCAWRAAEIRKALREGRQPTPPPAATTTAPAGSGGSISGGGGGAVDDLPPASGSSDWAYKSAAPAAPPPPPLVPASGSDMHMPPPPPSSAQGDFSFAPLPLTPPAASSASSSFSSGSAPPSAPLFASPPGSGGGGGGGGAARFWPGARVLVRVDESEGLSALSLSDHSAGGAEHEAQPGTVGQVLTRPDGGISYKVALRDRLTEVREEEAVPALSEGQPVALYRTARPGGPLGAATAAAVVLINDASWPPTYLVKTQDGDELAASASQLGPPLPAAAGGPASASAAAAPPPPPADLLGGGHYGGGPASASASTSTSSTRSAVAPPPPPAPYQPPPSGPASSGNTSTSGYPSMSGPGSYGPPAGPSAPPPPPAYGYGAPSSAPSAPPPPPPAWPPAQHTAPAPAPAPPAAAASYSLPPGYKPPLTVITEAQKAAKYAVSALSFEDVHTAVRYLNDALKLLTTQQQPHAPGRR
ncbi:hypothetical protein HYH02_000592 [Chlamydomonas schloesseri]|uniref:Vta1/callose synthase N-terminal domain-containing protein n=1 Tax=Chlamydomonas schloesseri TaxID=2026947 RepID=A0A835WWL3_9CHLO|nr:hypothetical protein HYH02_000592 [Chlamydomonas schloesseri]|eukprot:KAG2454757.1 hypothetical protein HYH02_000592 [Chlamydomonas schloesseri]